MFGVRVLLLAAAQPGFTIPAHLEKLAKPAQPLGN
jgi:hypothetical protein